MTVKSKDKINEIKRALLQQLMEENAFGRMPRNQSLLTISGMNS